MSFKLKDPVPVGPFLEWVERRLDRLAAAHGDEHGSVTALCGELGWEAETGARFLFRLRSGENRSGMTERARLEDALHHAGVGWWEVYGDDEPEGSQRWCGWCVEMVAVVDGDRCAWCGHATLAERPTRPARRRGVRPKLDDATLLKLHRIHRDKGASVLELSRRIYRRAGYKSARSCSRCIYVGWRRLGLSARDRVEQTVLSSRRHGLAPRYGARPGYGTYRRRVLHGREDRPRCRGVRQQHPRKGERCQARAMEGSDYCFAHDPGRELERQAITARMRKRQSPRAMLPAGPFIAWLNRLHAEHGTWARVGGVVGVDATAVHRYGRGVDSNGRTLDRIGVDTVRRYVTCAGTSIDAVYAEGVSMVDEGLAA